MDVGKKIKLIRNHRSMSQQELGIKLGYDSKGASVRVAQYETNYRVPKPDTLKAIAKILDVSPINFICEENGSIEHILQTLFWLDEVNPHAIHLFQLTRNPGKTNASDDTAIRYFDNDNWPSYSPVCLWFDYGVLDSFMKEWMQRKDELTAKKISQAEYFEWKINWPKTCDNNKKPKEWREK